jgi:pseudouridine synthase
LPFFETAVFEVNSRGLLLLTDDGFLTNRIAHPRYQLAKVYAVETEGDLSPGKLAKLQAGIEPKDGITAPAEVKVLGAAATTSPSRSVSTKAAAARSAACWTQSACECST